MIENTTIATYQTQRRAFRSQGAFPGMLVAWAPRDAVTVDRCKIEPPWEIGRSSAASLQVRDGKVSKKHVVISHEETGFWIEDLGSTNGTFVDGERLVERRLLRTSTVVRIGQTVFIFHKDASPFFEPPPTDRFGIMGTFHSGPLLRSLGEAALSARHVLLAGPSGSGKELAAAALGQMLGGPGSPLEVVAHNSARFASEEEAASTLFGVAPRVFSNVDGRPGLIELAHRKLLFLDEAHNLPERVQRTLLRVIEDGQTCRIGEVRGRPVEVRFVLASNAAPPTYDLAHDILARLRVVEIPPLEERKADIPTIFTHLLEQSLIRQRMAPRTVLDALGADHFEALCLDGFPEDNVRGLVDLADRLATRIRSGTAVETSIAGVFAERFERKSSVPPGPGEKAAPSSAPYSANERQERSASGSHYETNKAEIITAYGECHGNLAATERLLHERGIRSTRRWLSVFIKKWGVR